MLFTQPLFFVFFAVVFALAWGAGGNDRRKRTLLAASYLFYAAWDWRFLSLIVASTAIDYAAGLRMARAGRGARRRRWLVASMVVNLGMLGWFKYFNFFVDSATALIRPLGIDLDDRALAIVLPVGISFFTFQTMSYTIDVYRRRLEPVSSVLDFALFVSFFPQLVAGPIVRAARFLPQLERAPRFAAVDVRRFLVLFLTGLVKKACIADRLAPHVDQVFARPEHYTVLSIWIAVLLYAIQIYCDFSGYSDMAIACAGLLGYDLGINFHFPYLASNLTELWRRWHISLSSWLRDYLYIPLGGNRGARLLTARNLLLTMVLGGLWHGASWTFVCWGMAHGVGLIVHRAWARRSTRRPAGRAAGLLATGLTFYFVCAAWILFRAHSLGDAAVLLEAFVLLRSSGRIALDSALLAWPAVLAPVHWLASRTRPGRLLDTVPGAVFAAGYGAAAALALAFVPLRVEPFLYFQF